MLEYNNKDSIELDNQLIEQIAAKIHERWEVGRRSEGWTYGPVRDDVKKQHPCLIPYNELPESEKEYDRATAKETIESLLELSYKIIKIPFEETGVT